MSYGLVSSMTDPNGITTSWKYTDGFGRKTEEDRPDNTHTTWLYEGCSAAGGCLLGSSTLAVVSTVYAMGGVVQTDATTFYDQLERPLISKSRMLANGTYARNEVRYSNLGPTTQIAMPCTWSAVTTSCTYWIANTYDVLNRLTQSQRPISSTNNQPQSTNYVYAGRTTTITDPYSNVQTTVADVNGWLRQTTDPYNYTVTTAYDSAGSKTAVTDSLGSTLWSGTYNYGLAAYLASASDMDMGSWTYTVDALGELTGWKDANQQTFSQTYDALSRPLTRSEPDYFTQWTWGSTPASYNVGRLQSVCTGLGASPTNCTSSPGYSESETYDNVGRRLARVINIPGQSNPFTYTWHYSSTTGLLSTLVYPASYPSTFALQLQYAYLNGSLQSVTGITDSGNVTVWQANATNPAGQVTQETLGNGIVTNRTYDAVTHWVSTVQSGVGGGATLQNLGFLYDKMGNVTQRQDNNLGFTENIYYDKDYRFSYSLLNGTQNLSVTYDTTGNITSRSDINSGATWTYDPVHKHEVTQVGSTSDEYSYDTNGNALTRPAYGTMMWSSYNYPVSVATAYGPGWQTSETESFSYGPDRKRWQQQYFNNTASETTDYIGGLLEFVSSSGVLDYRHYIYAGNKVVAVYSRKNSGTYTFSYLLSDHQASLASIVNSSGVIGESFTPFGNRREATTWSGTPTNTELTTIAGITREGYTFQTALGLWSGINHMNGRVQDSWAGRFLSADPNIQDATNTQSYNRYSYANNNPLTYIDLSGFDCSSADPLDVTADCVPDVVTPGVPPNDGEQVIPPQTNQTQNNGTPTISPMGGPGGLQQALQGSQTFPPLQQVDVSATPLGDLSTGDLQIVGPPILYPVPYVTVTASRLPPLGRSILGNFGLSWLPLTPGYGLADCLFGNNCRFWSVAMGTAGLLPIFSVGRLGVGAVEGAESGLTLFRGVASDSPAFENALKGIANPIGGDASAVEHSLGNTASNFTSWTTDYDVAVQYATSQGTTNGVVLTYTFGPGAAFPTLSSIEAIMGESEFLVPGPVSGAIATGVP
ncbi:MAG: RHS repeat-associated core domain-containing protein [Steroidobacteraceae bacterium]